MALIVVKRGRPQGGRAVFIPLIDRAIELETRIPMIDIMHSNHHQSIELALSFPNHHSLPSYDHYKPRYGGLGEFGRKGYCTGRYEKVVGNDIRPALGEFKEQLTDALREEGAIAKKEEE
eukprot:scaffold42613_cov518-Skeletonema_marinoi.AAC.1